MLRQSVTHLFNTYTSLPREKLSIGVMPDEDGWKDFYVHPGIRLEIQGDLNRKQREQVRIVASYLTL